MFLYLRLVPVQFTDSHWLIHELNWLVSEEFEISVKFQIGFGEK
jgi:hypothetical protein